MASAITTPEMSETSATSPWLADFERNAPGHSGEPAALRTLRRQAIARFAEIGFPTPRQEQWRATNVAPIARTVFHRAAPETPEIASAALAPLTWDAAATLVFVDGRFAPALSRLEELPAGVFAGSLAEALTRIPSEIEPWLGQQASFAEHAFVALNTAFFEDGAFLWLPRGVVVERPIHLLFVATTGGGGPVVTFPRNLIVAGESSQVRVVETYAAIGGTTYFTCPVTEVNAGPNSVVDHYKVQRESHAAFHMATFALRQERSSALSSHSISLGGALVRNDVNALLDGEGSDTILNGLYMIGGRQFVDHHMRVEHAKPHCTSHELFKGVLDGHARSVFNGLIHVRHGAQKTDAKQSNRNLLLSRDAVANSNPQLEIFADDVKCTHGSTVGQLDDDAIFYLRSRGIGAEAARSLLTYAFASDIVERIKVEPVRKDLEEFLFTALPKGEVVRQAV
ncbi:MAG TPA: Fe-S cluster assembly protein SufD [Thermoanaerobaculia bacterium]|jgi:Fe-S cluster assembly protein SufD|nr:Fe-S cluster assembly protein SufD [Thermoanaerobaculia bacterium]